VIDPVPSEPPPAALALPSPLPGSIGVAPGGGYNGLAMIWGYGGYGISQEYVRTSFSVAHPTWYDYGTQYGLDGISHPGLDVSMPRGTWLYSPVSGTVVVSGNSAGFTFYGNGNSGVGELRIRTANGDEVILGHMGRIAVYPGDYVNIGQFVGVSGGFNGDHLHLEARQSQGGWHQIVDPRYSFITATIESTLTQPAADTAEVVPDEDVAEVDTVEPESPADPESVEPGDTDEPAPVSEASPVDGGAESSPLAASLEGTGQSAGTWFQGVDAALVEDQLPSDDDDVAAGLVETALRQPVLNLVIQQGGQGDEPEDAPPE
jgi:murein DD-endopeptidase MepM/ murein hydrolase activator NlpD